MSICLIHLTFQFSLITGKGKTKCLWLHIKGEGELYMPCDAMPCLLCGKFGFYGSYIYSGMGVHQFVVSHFAESNKLSTLYSHQKCLP